MFITVVTVLLDKKIKMGYNICAEEGGREEMCKVMEDMRNEAVKSKLAPIAMKMYVKGSSIEAIADFLEITTDEVKELLEKKSA